LRAPIVAPAAIVMFAVNCVALTKAILFTVMPEPLKLAVAPLTKPVPVIVMFSFVAPWPLLFGLVEVTAGAALTVNTPVPVPVPPSVFVTVTLRAPVAAPAATVTGTVIVVAFATVTAPVAMPVPLNTTVAPLAKPVPVIVTVVGPVPWAIALSDVEVTVGAALTVNTPVPVPVPPSVFVTVTLCAPSVAEAVTVTGSVIVVALTTVAAPRVMFGSLNETVAPLWNPVPVIVTVVRALFCPLGVGNVAVTVGTALTVNTPSPVPVPPSVFVTVMLCAPSVAEAVTVTGSVIVVALTTVMAPRVMFESLNETVAPFAKPVPVMVTVVRALPRARAFGAVELTVGAGFSVTKETDVRALPDQVIVGFVVPAVAIAFDATP